MIEICVEYWLYGRGAWTVNEIKISPSRALTRQRLFLLSYFISFLVFDSPFGSSPVSYTCMLYASSQCMVCMCVCVCCLLVSRISPYMLLLFLRRFIADELISNLFCHSIVLTLVHGFYIAISSVHSHDVEYVYVRMKWVYWWQARIFYSCRREINCCEDILFGDPNSRRCQTSVLLSCSALTEMKCFDRNCIILFMPTFIVYALRFTVH